MSYFLFLDSQFSFFKFINNLFHTLRVQSLFSECHSCNTLFLLTRQEFKSSTGDPFTDFKWWCVGKWNQDYPAHVHLCCRVQYQCLKAKSLVTHVAVFSALVALYTLIVSEASLPSWTLGISSSTFHWQFLNSLISNNKDCRTRA